MHICIGMYVCVHIVVHMHFNLSAYTCVFTSTPVTCCSLPSCREPAKTQWLGVGRWCPLTDAQMSSRCARCPRLTAESCLQRLCGFDRDLNSVWARISYVGFFSTPLFFEKKTGVVCENERTSNKKCENERTSLSPRASLSCWHTKIYQRNVEWQRKSGWQHNTTKHLTREWRTDRTCAVTRRRTGLNHLSQHLTHWLPARDNQTSGPGNPFFSL